MSSPTPYLLFCLILLALILGGCGQKGELTLPDQPQTPSSQRD
ncbi:MAG: lipoprotein [Gammaproteobacteria bacterium SHHR-1]